MIRPAVVFRIRSALFALVGALSRHAPPRALEPICVTAAVAAIRLYRLVLSPLVGRDCFFSTTCSRYAQARLLEAGWSQGWRDAHARMSDCGGEHQLVVFIDGRRRLKAASGRCYEEEDLARPREGAPTLPQRGSSL